jgi:hypothetical protein
MQSVKLLPLNANTAIVGLARRKSEPSAPSASHGAMPPNARVCSFMPSARATGFR